MNKSEENPVNCRKACEILGLAWQAVAEQQNDFDSQGHGHYLKVVLRQ